MAETLTSEGYFFTGHGELPARAVGALKAKIFPDSAILSTTTNDGCRISREVVCKNMKTCVNPGSVSKLISHLNARSSSPCGGCGLCSRCG